MADEKVLTTIEEIIDRQVEELRVSNGTPAKSLATTVLRFFDEGKRVALSCIGAQAAANALKAVAIANSELASQGKFFAVIPMFDVRRTQDRTTGQEIELTAIRLLIGRIPMTL